MTFLKKFFWLTDNTVNKDVYIWKEFWISPFQNFEYVIKP